MKTLKKTKNSTQSKTRQKSASQMMAQGQNSVVKAAAIQEQPSAISVKYLALSFILPFVIMGTVFTLKRIFPFGDSTILMHDFHHQYYPFLSNLWHKLREGTVSAWSWTAGMGHDYIALIAYYMASPLNLLAMLAPHAWLREALTLVILIKIGCAGLFTAIFLHYAFKQNVAAIAVFSSLYALCAFTLGYFWNIMWLDSFALLPLVMAGLLALMREGKFLLYIGALALAVYTNFYIGFFICVSAAMVFFAFTFIHRFSLRIFLSKLGMVAACSSLAVGMAAALLLPMYSALQSTYAIGNDFPPIIGLYNTSFFDILGNFIAFTPPTFLYGLPNLYSGMVSALLAGVFIVSAKIMIREKLVFIGAVVFLILSCNHSLLDYVMHGFHNTNDLPFRFTFLVSFMLAVMAYRAFLLADGMTLREGKISLAAMGICAALFLLSAIIGSQGKNAIIGSAVLCLFYMALFFSLILVKTPKLRTAIKAVFLLAIAAELFITAHIGFKSVELPGRSRVPYNYGPLQELLALRSHSDLPEARQPDEKGMAGRDFYRTEMIPYYIRNDASLYNYNGISFFSSTMNDDVMRFMRGLGMPAGGTANNFFFYHETSPLLNTFLNMRYMVVHGGFPADRGLYWEFIDKIEDSVLTEYKYYLPLGFMVNDGVAAYRRHPRNPFLSQNDLFKRATGLEESLFAVTDLSGSAPAAGEGNSGASTWDYEMPYNGLLCAYFTSGEDYIRIGISINGTSIRSINTTNHIPYISTVGRFSKGDVVSFTQENGSLMYAGCFNSGLFEQGYALLADEVLNLTHFSETKVSGTVTALKDGILYTSIPGLNWDVYVDGVKRERLLIDNAMAAVRLSTGTHEVEFRYVNKSLTAGMIISLIFIVLVLVWKLFKKNGVLGV